MIAVRLAVQVHHGLLVSAGRVAGSEAGPRHVVAGVARSVEHPGRGLDPGSDLSRDSSLLLVTGQQPWLSHRLGLQDRQALPRPEGELRLEEKLVAEVGDGLRAVLGAVSEQGDCGGRQGGGDDPGTGQGGAVLQSNSSSTAGRHLRQHTVSGGCSCRQITREQNKAKWKENRRENTR